MQQERKNGSRPRSAGLPLSVGGASRTTRVLLSLAFGVNAVLCTWAAVLAAQSRSAAATAVAILLIQPIAIAAFVAAMYVAAPYSAFGRWLDAFLPRLASWGAAVLVALTLWAFSAVVVFALSR